MAMELSFGDPISISMKLSFGHGIKLHFFKAIAY